MFVEEIMENTQNLKDSTFYDKQPILKLPKGRNSNFEILRLVCMLLIVWGHYFGHGLAGVELSTINVIVMNFFGVFSNIAVLIFMLVSGYFAPTSRFTIYKWLKLLFEFLFYMD